MKINQYPIGIFDSGIGGLTVAKEVMKLLPNENIVYLGDTAHLPYGTKSEKTIIKLAISSILFLLEKEVKLIIIACNSTSAVALPRISGFFKLPVLGVVDSGVESALRKNAKRIGIIGTPATIRSSVYQNLLRKSIPGVKITAKSCPLFVPLAEEKWLDNPITEEIARIYLKGFQNRVDFLILGCTHYPLLKKVIAKVLPGIGLIDSAEAVANKAKKTLSEKDILNKSGKGNLSVYLTDYSPHFQGLIRMILRKDVAPKVIENV